MKTLTAAAIGLGMLLLAGAAAAQDAAPPAADANHAAAGKKAPPDPRAQGLFDEARKAIAGLPETLVPMQLMNLGSAEEEAFPDAAGKDFVAALEKAQALPGPRGDGDKTGMANTMVKNTVTHVSIMFLGMKQPDKALELVRTITPVDGSKASLYDALLALPQKSRTPEQTVALIHECVAADGSFPFGAALNVINDSHAGPDVRGPLVREAYAAIAKNPESGQGVFFLSAAHKKDPELDPQLEDVLVTLLQSMAKQNGNAMEKQFMAGEGNSLMKLLAQVDAAKAQELKTAMPDFATPPPSLPSIGGITIQPNAAGDDFNISMSGPLGAIMTATQAAMEHPDKAVGIAAAVEGDSDRFLALSETASILVKMKHEKEGKEAADTALALLDTGKIELKADLAAPPADDEGDAGAGSPADVNKMMDAMMPGPVEAAAELAGALAGLGESEAAAKLIEQAITAVEKPLGDREREYQATAGAERTTYAMYLSEHAQKVQAVFKAAAEVNFDAAAAAAREFPCEVMRPAALIAVGSGLNQPDWSDLSALAGGEGGGER